MIKNIVRNNRYYQRFKAYTTDRYFSREQDYYNNLINNIPSEDEIFKTARNRISQKNTKKNTHIILYLPCKNDDGCWQYFNIPSQFKRICPVSICFFDQINNRNELIFFVKNSIKQDSVNIFFTDLSYSEYLDNALVQYINSLNIITIFMNLDDDVKFNSINSKGEYDGPRQNASKVDLYLTTSKYSVKKYIAHSGRAIFIPPGANPEIFKPLNLKIKYDVVFIGQIYGVRKRLIESLKKSGINVAVFGRNSHTCIPTINEMNYIWNQSYIVLGHGGIGYSWDTRNIKGRDFEAIVSGACYITTYHPVLDEIFQEYNDIVFYKNTQECIAKIKMLLNDKSLIDKIKHNARMIRNEHTWEKRMINVMSRLGIGNHDSGYIDH